MKQFIKTTWRHFSIMLPVSILLLLFIPIFHDTLSGFSQIIVMFMVGFLLNLPFEIWQAGRSANPNTFKEMMFDCLSAGLGALFGTLIYQIF